MHPGRRVGRTLASLVLLGLLAMALFPSLVAAGDDGACRAARALAGPSSSHPFGFDLQGCDLLGRVALGSRTSLLVAALVVGLSLGVGLLLGAVAGLAGGWVDTIASRAADIVTAVPTLIVALFLLSLLDERGIWQVVAALGAFGWALPFRVARSAAAQAREAEFVLASRTLGATTWHLLRRHVMPQAMLPLRPLIGPLAAGAVAGEAVLSFVGAGLQLPTTSWGLQLAALEGRAIDAPHLLFPALMLTLLVVALTVLGSGVRRGAG